jgi:hypothetical protein
MSAQAITALTDSLIAGGHTPSAAAELASMARADKLVDADGQVDRTAVTELTALIGRTTGVTVRPRRAYGAGAQGPLIHGAAESQAREQARLRGFVPPNAADDKPQPSTRGTRGAAGRAEAERRFGQQARR